MGPHASKGSIAFLIPHPYVDTLACFREPIKWLADAGWQIDVYTSLDPMHPPPNFGRENIRIIPIEVSRKEVLHFIYRFVAKRPKYRWLWTVPQWGLYYGSIASTLTRTPMVCISDELIVEDELTTPEQLRWKKRERAAHQRCRFTIALSTERAEIVRRENRLAPNHPIYVVPNSAPGPARQLTSHYFQDTLGIQADKRILLHAGGLWWKVADDLSRAVETWTGDWVLVFQGRNLAQISGRKDSQRVRFSQTVLPGGLMDYAASSSHVGLALYDNYSLNIRLAGTASGKVTLYLKNALPVIATAFESFKWIEREGCGICVESVNEVQIAAERIWADYEKYVSNVKRFYSATLDFQENFQQVAMKLQ
jgi:hypothetical protein